MLAITMPKAAKKIIDKLCSAGYEAYIVGGCVRDRLLGKEPDDYDITTSAPASEVKRLFERTIDTGIAHGTVTVIENGEPYEVTTFRVDGEYKDNRHPVSVSFTSNVEDDLARRDFTVNALAYNDERGIVDAFSGIDDLNNKIIRCVGEPEKRFSEDALRVLRGIRFSAVLGFKIEEKTSAAIKKYAPSLNSISSERIYTEWKKLLSGDFAYDVILSFRDVLDVFVYELKDTKVPTRAAFCGLTWDERQTALFYSVGSGKFESFAKRLKMDSKTRDTGISVLNSLKDLSDNPDYRPESFVLGKSDEVSLKSAKIAASLGICEGRIAERIRELISVDAVRKISQLNINGNDLLSLGIRGEKIGKILTDTLYLVSVGEIKNEREELINHITENI